MITQYFSTNLEQILPFIFLYTEIHHRFKYIGSKYYKKEPEIIVDIPHRIEPNHDIPLLVLVKDSPDFPIRLITGNSQKMSELVRDVLERHDMNFEHWGNAIWKIL